jgi:hypothetical protein
MSTQEKGNGRFELVTFHFIRRGLQLNELPIEDNNVMLTGQ